MWQAVQGSGRPGLCLLNDFLRPHPLASQAQEGVPSLPEEVPELPFPPVTGASLLQHCNGVDWRQKLDSQRGAVIATELKNNSYKLARWTCCALLAGSEYLKLG